MKDCCYCRLEGRVGFACLGFELMPEFVEEVLSGVEHGGLWGEEDDLYSRLVLYSA